MPLPTRKCSPPKHGFRGHPNYRNAHSQILNNPFKSETQYFETRDFKPNQVFWNLETASSSQSSVSATANLLRQNWNNVPSGEEVLKLLRDISEVDAEAMANRVLLAQYRLLPAAVRNELEQDATIILDFHCDPYWGNPGKVAVLHGQKEHDSNFHFVYLTADLISAHYRFTIFTTSRVEGFPAVSYFPAVLAQVRHVTKPRLLLFDGEFPTVEVLLYLEQALIPWNARKSQTKGVKDAILAYVQDPQQLKHRRWHIAVIKDSVTGKTVHIHVTVQQVHGKLKVITKPIWHSQPVEEAEKNYNKRFGIDSGYKDKHAFLARTSSRSWVVRLALFLVSILLWNVWRLALAWTFLKGLPPLPCSERRTMVKQVISFHLTEFFWYEGWRL